MEKQTLTVLNGLGTLCNAIIWEINDGESLNDGILEQLEFLIESRQYGGVEMEKQTPTSVEMEKQTLTVLNGLGTLCNAIIWEINDGESLNDGILEQLEFLIESRQFY